MVVKTELCSFSERRIYPGHGIKFVRRDGQLLTLGSSKSRRMLNLKKKPAKLMWTLSWRRLNKKLFDANATKKKARKAAKPVRAIVGASLDELRMKRQATKKVSAATEAAMKEVKERSKASAAKKGGKGRAAGASIPKNQKSAASSSKGNTGR